MKGKIGRSTHLTKGRFLPKYSVNQLCPSCNSTDKPKYGFLKLRKSRFGEFLGCSRYPLCKFTTTRIRKSKKFGGGRKRKLNYNLINLI